ncbi:hypothetical protein [Paraburkholderia unamae]|uniref:Uncharacterized protein n=1 Tax=Paraburkholderia unamae TaxID=219649 RepID=A0ACC6RIG3_9BURK
MLGLRAGDDREYVGARRLIAVLVEKNGRPKDLPVFFIRRAVSPSRMDGLADFGQPVRYHGSGQSNSSAASFNVPVVYRFLLVCLLALLSMRGAMACEQAQHDALAAHAAITPHVVVAAGDRCAGTGTHDHGSHSPCGTSCCVAGCAHCSVPSVVTAFDAQTGAGSALTVLPAALRAGITHAPPLPPPIA